LESYPELTWPTLEATNDRPCDCCGARFTAEHPMELISGCHDAPLRITYRDGYLYMRCFICDKPLHRIQVSTKLI
jgi:hypothetical protein